VNGHQRKGGGYRLPFAGSPYPWTLRLITINVLVFIVLQYVVMQGRLDGLLARMLILHPHYFFRGAIWQLITYMFMHSPAFSFFLMIPLPTHLFFNMFFLWMMGREVEVNLGSATFLRIYFIAGIVAGICALFTGSPTLGASGAVLGILAVFGQLFPDRIILLMFIIPMRARYFIWLVAALDLYGAIAGGSNVAHLAHIGGLFTGIIMMKTGWYRRSFFDLGEWRRRRELEGKRRARRRVDEILEKISREGIQSLNRQERDFLERMRKGE